MHSYERESKRNKFIQVFDSFSLFLLFVIVLVSLYWKKKHELEYPENFRKTENRKIKYPRKISKAENREIKYLPNVKILESRN